MTGARKTVIFLLAAFVGLPAALVAAGLAWFGTVWVAYNLKLGWVEVPVHYRLSFGVEAGGVAYIGSTVVQVTYRTIPYWQMLTVPTSASLYEGQAGYVKLPKGKVIFLLPHALSPIFGFADKRPCDVIDIANYLLSVNGSPSGPTKKWAPIYSSNAATVTGSSDLPNSFLPPMIFLENADDVSTARFFHPEHPEQTLGDQSRFLGAQIAVTSDPVSQGIEAEFSWLEPGHSWALGNPGDSFRQENRGDALIKGDFFLGHRTN